MAEAIPPEIVDGLEAFRKQAAVSWAGDIVLEENENSDLAPNCKPANRLFFEKVFGATGSFWKAYETLGLGSSPKKNDFFAWAGNRMYFCTNSTQRRIFSNGLMQEIHVSGQEMLVSPSVSLDNLLLAVAAPLEQLKNAARVAVAALRINEKTAESDEFLAFAKKYYDDNKAAMEADPLERYAQTVDLASRAMEYSVYASIALTLNLRLAASASTISCEANELSDLLSNAPSDLDREISDRFGFYSIAPYDLSLPRYGELAFQARILPPTPIIYSPYLRWRENAKFAAARFLAIARKGLLEHEKKLGLVPGEVFFLSFEELKQTRADPKAAKDLARRNREAFEKIKAYSYPPAFAFTTLGWMTLGNAPGGEIAGTSVGERKFVEGAVVRVDAEKDYAKVQKGSVVVSDVLSPNLVTLYDRCAAVVSKTGGRLSHAAIVAREMKVVCIAKTANIEALKDGETVEVDGTTGRIIRTQAHEKA